MYVFRITILMPYKFTSIALQINRSPSENYNCVKYVSIRAEYDLMPSVKFKTSQHFLGEDLAGHLQCDRQRRLHQPWVGADVF